MKYLGKYFFRAHAQLGTSAAHQLAVELDKAPPRGSDFEGTKGHGEQRRLAVCERTGLPEEGPAEVIVQNAVPVTVETPGLRSHGEKLRLSTGKGH